MENGISPEPNLCMVSFISYIEAYINPNILIRVSDQVDSFFHPKNASEKNDKNILRHLLVNFKNVRVLAPQMLCSIKLWGQWQPLMFPPIQASNEALRHVQHERRNVVIRVRDCRTTKIQE